MALRMPGRVLTGRGCRAQAAAGIVRLGRRVLLVRSASVGWSEVLAEDLRGSGAEVSLWQSRGEPDLGQLLTARAHAAAFGPDVVVAVGGGSAIDLGKALAALIPAAGDPVVHFEVVGEGRALEADPLPFVAIPTTSGTGAEATKNAVIAMPGRGLKVSLRDDRMLAALAVVDPALTDGCPRGVTLASGLDAVVQVIEPYLSSRATAETDAICREAIPMGLAALARLMEGESAPARDDMAHVSLSGGIALANAGLGAVHGLAGVLGGMTGAAHGMLCGRLMPGVLRANRAAAEAAGMDLRRFGDVAGWINAAYGAGDAAAVLEARIDGWGLARLGSTGLARTQFAEVTAGAARSSSMKANPVVLSEAALAEILAGAM
jgi:alcohol dehydrogenase class IV